MNQATEINEAPDTTDDKSRVRLWLRLLRASRAIEGELRERLRTTYSVTLPRFDVMAALYREPEGMLMSQLSKYLMVSNGNVTGLIDRLTTDGLVQRTLRDGDRRTSVVLLTSVGRVDFEKMAKSHREWINELLSHFSPHEAEVLADTLKVFASDWEGEAR
ncbi:MarR family transcriptional regulator [Pseudovibrio sp. Tun.PSC04-5.I4]|uniref:MarR family winged helix-turn-helix transcriptional regulator n=1 Tax=Pseudovibrio sp. Tun.PSC04-5.I4 TaxID=1798213 RepID=UPI00087DF4B2|nr:MarR family transcriptional regulator [Pseudovibrio sp. Tun.PSC04-5.I4]SDR02861.1 DNA-binding transcriptional regulator, MarR family [Pseudovibrio sp. Tun.PSC04-5.I4]